MTRTVKTPTWFEENKVKLRPIYVALSVTTILMGLAAHMTITSIEPASQKSMDSGTESMQMLLSVVGMSCCFFAMVFHQWMLKPKRVKEHPLGAHVHSHILMSYLLTWILAQSCATIGLVIAVLTKDPEQYSMFGVLSLLTILAHPYTEGRVRRAIILLK